MEEQEQIRILKELAAKAKDAEKELLEARSAMETEKAKYLKWKSWQGEVKYFGNVKVSPKIPIWVAAIVIGGALSILIYAASSARSIWW